MNRTVNVVRMQTINRTVFLWTPLLIVGGALVISLAVYGLVAQATGTDTPIYGGGASAALWYFAVIGIQALTMTFPFSQSLSVTRREFYQGTLLTAALSALGISVIYVLGGLIERATGGWWMNGYFFALPWIWERGPLAAGIVWFVAAMFIFILGFWAATIYKRLGMPWLIAILLGLAAVGAAMLWLINGLHGWSTVGDWITVSGPLGPTLWLAAISLIAAIASYFTLRRAVP